MEVQANASKASRPSACTRRLRITRGLAPLSGLQGAPPCLEKCVFCELNVHNFRPFLGLNLQICMISSGRKGEP